MDIKPSPKVNINVQSYTDVNSAKINESNFNFKNTDYSGVDEKLYTEEQFAAMDNTQYDSSVAKTANVDALKEKYFGETASSNTISVQPHTTDDLRSEQASIRENQSNAASAATIDTHTAENARSELIEGKNKKTPLETMDQKTLERSRKTLRQLGKSDSDIDKIINNSFESPQLFTLKRGNIKSGDGDNVGSIRQGFIRVIDGKARTFYTYNQTWSSGGFSTYGGATSSVSGSTGKCNRMAMMSVASGYVSKSSGYNAKNGNTMIDDFSGTGVDGINSSINKFGLTAKDVTSSASTKSSLLKTIQEASKNGNSIIVHGSGFGTGTSTHWVAFLGANSKGQVYLSDSSNYDPGWYNLSDLDIGISDVYEVSEKKKK